MSQKNPSLSELTTLVEGIVAQVLNKSFGGQMTTWAANNSRTSLYLSRETGDRGGGSGLQLAGDFYKVGQFAQIAAQNEQFQKLFKFDTDKLSKLGSRLSSVAGIASAYQTGDALSGAMSGAALGPWGAAAGLLAGLLSPGIDRWQRPKFKDAKQAFDKLFTMDRGERDDYYLPDSFYFRSGNQGGRKITVHLGNQHFDEHIRESLTNNYAAQLQRGLVF